VRYIVVELFVLETAVHLANGPAMRALSWHEFGRGSKCNQLIEERTMRQTEKEVLF